MKLVLLTTDTSHHTYFAAKLGERFPVHTIFVETRALKAPFETFHPFEARRDAYEREHLLAGLPTSLSALGPVHAVESINHPQSIEALQRIAPDVILVFGTGKLSAQVIDSADVALNLHGGNPEHYRGLDTHLWAIYHDDFDQLVTTLHHLDRELDTGDIVLQGMVPLTTEMELHALRAANTRVCLDLSLLTLEQLDRAASLPRRKQVSRGRYYSFMPSALKEVCVTRLKRRAQKLAERSRT